MLRSVPSFSIFTATDGVQEQALDSQRDELMGGDDDRLERSVTIGDSIEAIGSGDFSFVKNPTMGLIEEEEDDDGDDDLNGFGDMGIEEGVEPVSPPMYLATGFGIGGLHFDPTSFDEPEEEHYQRMVVEDPCNPLFLRNYAQLLQSKGDLHGAEEFYSRATLADPQDGEILLQYAKLVWELHRDQDRALIYFERAALAAPEDSHILAAYASFLWEIDEDTEKDHATNDHLKIPENEGSIGVQNPPSEEGNKPISSPLHFSGEDGNLDEHYKRMIDESPCNSLLLRNYAQFLVQSKGDLCRAEEYYSRAIVADPKDGETISRYAKLVWELHRDQHKAATYFERAVQASPGDSHVLAAYASFLWETEEEEEVQDHHHQLLVAA